MTPATSLGNNFDPRTCRRCFFFFLHRRCSRAVIRLLRGADNCVVRAHAGDAWDADAGRLDDVDGLDANAGTNVDPSRCIVPRDVDRDDGGDDAAVADADAVALRQIATGKSRPGRLTLLAGLGYFFVWALFGLAVFPLGVALAALEMEQPAVARAVPFAVSVVLLIAGAVQFTSWKAHHLACCRETKADACTPWRHGLRFGFHCVLSCANLTAILLVIGVMDLRAMTVVTAAITAERLAPAGKRVAQVIGAIVVGAGLLRIAQAAGLA